MIRATLLIALVSALVGCRPKAEASSEVKYGHIDERISYSLLNVPPNGTIALCGNDATDVALVAEAIRQWLVPVSRDTNITIDQTCNQSGGRPDAFVDVSTVPNQAQRAFCQQAGAVGYSSAQGRSDVGGSVVRCQKLAGVPLMSHTLHEVGHLFAMCDQYSIDDQGELKSTVGMHVSCSKTNTNGVATISVMNAGQNKASALTADDIEGIQAMARRSDIPANAQWDQFQSGSQTTPDAKGNVSTNSVKPDETTTVATPATPTKPSTTKPKEAYRFGYKCYILCKFADERRAMFMAEGDTAHKKTDAEILAHYKATDMDGLVQHCHINSTSKAKITSIEIHHCF